MLIAALLAAHDFGLLAMAFVASALLCNAALHVMPRRPGRSAWRNGRAVFSGIILGGTLWAVLLLSWKGYFPHIPATPPLPAILSSLVLAIAGGSAAAAILTHGDPGTRNTLLAGSILAASASCMLFVTMSALAAPLTLGYDLVALLLSTLGCTLMCSFGLHRIRMAPSLWAMVGPGLLIAASFPILDIASYAAMPPFAEWETAAATPGAPMLVLLAELAAILALTRAGAVVDRQTMARTGPEHLRLRQLAESMFEGLVVHRGERIVDANSAFYALTGLKRDKIPGRPVADFAPFSDTNAGSPVVETGPPRADGETIPVEILSRAIDLGQRDAEVAAVRDIRERQAAELAEVNRRRMIDLQHETEEARERQRIAEEASRAKSAFLAMMSHEIRTPMNAVLGLTASLLDDPMTPEQRGVVKAIHASGGSLPRILNDILDFSRLDAGRMTFENAPFSPATLIQQILSVHGPAAAEKGLTLDVAGAADLPARLNGDAGRIGQVLHNLVSNAIKFTRSGSVTVHARCLGQSAAGAEIEWTVTDTGIGIGPDKLGGLFDAFVQADNSITRRFGGSGLGLAISKQLVTQMGGEIFALSMPAEGSLFRVQLTLSVVETPATSPRDVPADNSLTQRLETLGRPLRLLLAEDNLTNQFVFARMLRGLAVTIDTAGDGVKAVAMAGERGYDLICMDMSMPEMDGLEATRLIRRGEGPNRTAPIVAMTANAFPEDVEACMTAGMNDFVSKPVSKQTLLEAILRAMPSEESERAAA